MVEKANCFKIWPPVLEYLAYPYTASIFFFEMLQFCIGMFQAFMTKILRL